MCYVSWKEEEEKVTIQLIDTPVHVDFSVEVNRSVTLWRSLAKSGEAQVTGHTEKAVHALMPGLVLVTKWLLIELKKTLCHVDQLCATGNTNIKADSCSYNTVLHTWVKSGEIGAPQRVQHILSIMEIKYENGDTSLKPNTRS